ncbi:urea transporter [Pandoraea thiooxydans]|nr:urea transporter [Pandoraea thiooxydans]
MRVMNTFGIPWPALVRGNTFLRACWRGLAQVYFQSDVFTGMAFFAILVLAAPLVGLGGALGSVVATATAGALRLPRRALRTGLYGYNGALTGIALAALFEPGIALAVWLVITAAASVALTHLLLARRVPALTGPFVGIMLLTMAYAPALGLAQRHLLGTGCQPSDLGFVFCSIGQVVFVAPLVLGLLLTYILAVRDARTTGWAMLGTLLVWAGAAVLGPGWPALAAQIGGIGVNSFLAALGLGMFGFNVPARIAGAIAASLLCLLFGALAWPYFTLPFNLAVWGLWLLRERSRRMAR